MWMPFLTQDINVHFHILFIAKFELFKLHSKVRSFEQMFKFNQVRLGPSINECQFSNFEGLPTTFKGSSNVSYNTTLLTFVPIGANA